MCVNMYAQIRILINQNNHNCPLIHIHQKKTKTPKIAAKLPTARRSRVRYTRCSEMGGGGKTGTSCEIKIHFSVETT